ncbi:MAG TPA: hypothetical protein VFA10_08295, partial [Ktedonobacteraceae bacterium]|nr:hypothetical protein [Ktedonobacteraceae bacterium]
AFRPLRLPGTSYRVTILQTRMEALQARSQNRGRYRKYLDSPIADTVQPYVEKLTAFNEQQTGAELEWLARMIEQVQ